MQGKNGDAANAVADHLSSGNPESWHNRGTSGDALAGLQLSALGDQAAAAHALQVWGGMPQTSPTKFHGPAH